VTWLAWRQFRSQAMLAGIATVAVLVALAASRSHIAEVYSSDGAGELTGVYVWLRLLGTVLIGVPAAIGAFWGAPLIATEIERHTDRLVWTQSVTRRRWLATKLALIAVVCVVTVGVFTTAFTRWAAPIDAVGNRVGTADFGQRGIVPVSYALFALALGTLLGLVIRRTLPAVAATIAVFIVVRMAVQQLIRPNLIAPIEMSTPTFDQRSLTGWILSTRTVDSAGRTINDFENQIAATCNITRQTPDYENAIATCAHRLGIHDISRLHPANHFWTLQYYEFGIFITIAAALTIASFYILRRSPS
jgi:ABC-type transport system involved in multi-copper enzyme maturation permease subunit